jgi:phospholipid/cholesterol/gamma-HCH transport system substrate-binding protein
VIRRGVKVQLAAFVVLMLVGTSYVGARYVGLDDALTGAGYSVTAEFGESGGIYENAEVTYRGVTVGRVSGLDLSDDGVAVSLDMEDDARVPSDVTAVVANRSAIGEQYVDLRPHRASGPYLEDGDAIPRERTQTPVSTNSLLVNLDRLVRSVPRDDLATVVDELGTTFDGTGDDLTRLVDNGNALTEEATAALPETVRLLEDGEVVLDTQRDSAEHIKAFSRDLATLTEQVRRSDADLRGVLDHGAPAAGQVNDVLRTNRASLSVLVANLLTVNQVQAVRLPALEQILVTYPANVAGGYTVVPGDGTAHFGLALNADDPPACTEGYGGTDKRTPADTGRKPVNTDFRCTEPEGSPTSVRGAQHAPRGPDTPTYEPGFAGARDGGSGPGDDGDTSGDGSSEEAAGGEGGGSGAEPVVAGYDPVTGETVTPQGTPLVIGSLGGQHEAFGEDSWKWLLLGPLAD